MHVDIFTDGSARGNPDGPGGYGTVLQYRDPKGRLYEKELSAGYAKTTNNRMELMAAIAGLEVLVRPCEVDLYSDSQYLVNAFSKRWVYGWKRRGWVKSDGEPVKNRALWERLLAAMEPHEVTFHWVRGHAGNELNERCDALATAAADGDRLAEDNLGS